MEQKQFIVDPRQLQAEALREPPRWGLDAYRETIRVLKEEKGFSLREIATWLQGRGMDFDHNAVWRTYARRPRESRVTSHGERSEQNEHAVAYDGALPWLKQS